MQIMELARGRDRPLKLLCLGAHSDDIEIGILGTLFNWIDQKRSLEVFWAVLAAESRRAQEARASAQKLLSAVESSTIEVKQFRESYFPFVGAQVKDYFEHVKDNFSPDLVFTHCPGDRHQDHRTLSDLTWNTFRNHLILEYEVPKYDGDLGAPNVFVSLDESQAKKKASWIVEHFPSQSRKHWFSQDTFLSLMRLRGVESGAGFAEAFYCRKLVLG